MRFSLELTPKFQIKDIMEIAAEADSLGFDSIWVSDHYNHRNAFIVLFAIANSTYRVKIGPGILSPYTSHPAYIAQLVATLAECAGGRVVCGIGAGDLTVLRQLGIERTNVIKNVEVAIRIVRDLLSGKDVHTTYNGRVIHLTKLSINPPQSEIPIYVGAQGEKMLMLACRIADGVLVNASDIDLLRKSYRIVRDALTEHGRDFRRFDIAAHVSFSLDEDLEYAKRAAAIYAAYMLAGSNERVLEGLGVEGSCADKIREALLRSDTQTAKMLVEPYVEKFVIVAKPSKLLEIIKEISSIGYMHLVFGPPLGREVKGTIRLIASTLPSLKE